jgi:hypothetical protein
MLFVCLRLSSFTILLMNLKFYNAKLKFIFQPKNLNVLRLRVLASFNLITLSSTRLYYENNR